MHSSTINTDQRIRIVLRGLRHGNLDALCAKYNISRRTYHNWQLAFIEGAKIHLGNDYLNSNVTFLRWYRTKVLSEQLTVTQKLQAENLLLKRCLDLCLKWPKKKSYSSEEKILFIERIERSPLPKRVSAKILGITSNTYLTWKKKQLNGTLVDYVHPNFKSDNDFYKDRVFKLLHEPPSRYNINRTTWRLNDIHTTLLNKGIQIGKGTIIKIIKNAGFRYRRAKVVLTSNDPEYKQKLSVLKRTLSNLKNNEAFFSIDEYGPLIIRNQGGRSWTQRSARKTYKKRQKPSGIIIMTAAIELRSNQVTHFYSKIKNTDEMIKLIHILREKYSNMKKLYLSWDAASWHSSKKLHAEISKINSKNDFPKIGLVPLPARAPFLNVIESVFSGMCKAIIHHSDYQSRQECVTAINRYFKKRNSYYLAHPKKVGKEIWGEENVKIKFNEGANFRPHHFMTIRESTAKNRIK